MEWPAHLPLVRGGGVSEVPVGTTKHFVGTKVPVGTTEQIHYTKVPVGTT